MKTDSYGTKILSRGIQLAICLFLLFPGSAFSGGHQQKTKVDPRDVYLDLEGLCGCEGMPYEYTSPPKQHIKTQINEKDIYLDMEALCGCEGLPYRYLLVPSQYIKIKHSPEDRGIDVEKMLSEDPSGME